ncbi:hypothetical protein [Cohnella sp. JJ-181]|uniref:hypothetical protein n=1 Tax=Cohnella rhizoplanae TaxID=2974897 RepID=UPI0022FF80D1|nr:hypothetical protein [Cohnella sp. JJ-181]CAI6083580.1 hypothetical protein COHCIP112018_04048 [Cohnella sp. JJ-181]
MTEAAGTEELDLQEAAELFRLIYPAFAALLDKAEAARGPLKEFHLAMAAEHAKSGVRILGWDSRRAINAIFELYKEHYLAEGRIAADLWAADSFGCDLEAAIVESEDVRELEERIKAVVLQIRQREAEMQRLRRELSQLEEQRAELSRPVVLHGSIAGAACGTESGDASETGGPGGQHGTGAQDDARDSDSSSLVRSRGQASQSDAASSPALPQL